eukprot:3142738-Pyramimonas_sp.AAC.1
MRTGEDGAVERVESTRQKGQLKAPTPDQKSTDLATGVFPGGGEWTIPTLTIGEQVGTKPTAGSGAPLPGNGKKSGKINEFIFKKADKGIVQMIFKNEASTQFYQLKAVKSDDDGAICQMIVKGFDEAKLTAAHDFMKKLGEQYAESNGSMGKQKAKKLKDEWLVSNSDAAAAPKTSPKDPPAAAQVAPGGDDEEGAVAETRKRPAAAAVSPVLVTPKKAAKNPAAAESLEPAVETSDDDIPRADDCGSKLPWSNWGPAPTFPCK